MRHQTPSYSPNRNWKWFCRFLWTAESTEQWHLWGDPGDTFWHAGYIRDNLVQAHLRPSWYSLGTSQESKAPLKEYDQAAQHPMKPLLCLAGRRLLLLQASFLRLLQVLVVMTTVCLDTGVCWVKSCFYQISFSSFIAKAKVWLETRMSTKQSLHTRLSKTFQLRDALGQPPAWQSSQHSLRIYTWRWRTTGW